MVTVAAAAPNPAPFTPAPAQRALASARKGSTVTPVPAALAPRKQGSWRVQLGAFGVASNAEKLWGQIASHTALHSTAHTNPAIASRCASDWRISEGSSAAGGCGEAGAW